MDISNLAVQYDSDDYVRPSEPTFEHLPAGAAMAMPVQTLGAEGRMAAGRPASAPSNIVFRRTVLALGTILLTAAAAWTPVRLYAKEGFMPLEVLGLSLFLVLITAICCWFTSSVIGTVVLLKRGQGRDELDFAAKPPLPRVRTALLMPVYNEDPAASMARLAQIDTGIARLNAGRSFDIFVLSDTTNDAVAAQEWTEFNRLRANARCRVYYRRRSQNTERKSGNIADWVRRFGGAYENMIILDADSTMAGETILHLVDAMERNPGIGLIQTTPTIVNATTLFARASQFGIRLYGRVASAGLAWWSGSEASYWGHNAIVRVRAFAQCAGLPHLPGRKPFGGHVLSHDVVEAGLLRRGGWGVHVTAALGGSHEETPPNLLEFIKRERRWCQGNMQHLGIIGAKGLHPMSRFQMIVGLMAYLASPLWLLSLVGGMMIQIGNRPDWSTLWYFLHPELNPLMWATLLTTGLLMGPKLMGWGLAFFSPTERAQWGGGWMLFKGLVMEMALSAITAPIYMIGNTRAVFEILTGRDSGWAVQARSCEGLSKQEAALGYRNETFAGVFFTGFLILRPDLLMWVWPIVVPLLLAGPIARWTSRRDVGLAVRARGYMITPEELAMMNEAHGEVVVLATRAARQALFEPATEKAA
ncbi:MAG: glucans biosynthesis glucosyltransferase MdoH [Caulobacter sp.]|nr:glucans biosynthesis glucosyltransferase MdoH [Caulobacter sp.]